MSNKFVNDPMIKVLLNRREEIKNKVNKLQAEYQAIGELIKRDYEHNHPLEIGGDER